jgi:hypothetical protein
MLRVMMTHRPRKAGESQSSQRPLMTWALLARLPNNPRELVALSTVLDRPAKPTLS